MNFNTESHLEILEDILNPRPERAQGTLAELGLSGLPSREDVHREIEAKLLVPKSQIPSHWLPTYQMYEVILKCNDA